MKKPMTILFTEEQREKLQEAASKAGLTVAAFVRMAALARAEEAQ